MKLKKYVILVAILLTPAFSYGDRLLKTFTVKRVFAESAHTGGFYPNEALPECKWGLMYVDLSKESGKAIFSLLLAAKAASQSIIRIDYTVSSSGTCMVTGLHTQ